VCVAKTLTTSLSSAAWLAFVPPWTQASIVRLRSIAYVTAGTHFGIRPVTHQMLRVSCLRDTQAATINEAAHYYVRNIFGSGGDPIDLRSVVLVFNIRAKHVMLRF